jgi:purine-binding chemotaxis protein CheW
LQVCVFVLGGRLPAVEARHVLEVFNLDDLTPVPTAPSFVVGVAAVRGLILPVIDAAPLVGATSRPPRGGDPLIRVGIGDAQAALVAERVLGVREVAVPAGGDGGSLVVGRGPAPEGEVVVLDLAALFDRARA